MRTSDSINELATALSAAQAELKAAPMTGRNPHLKNKYATLNDIIDTARGPLAKHGMAYVQMPTSPADLSYGVIGLTTRLMHKSGQWLEDDMYFPVDPGSNRAVNPAQVAGSTITYMRRYALAAMLGIVADEDADGETAAHAPAAKPQVAKTEAAPTYAKGRTYADGQPVDVKAADAYDVYVAEHGGEAPTNVHNLRNWYKTHNANGKTAQQPAPQDALFAAAPAAVQAALETLQGKLD